MTMESISPLLAIAPGPTLVEVSSAPLSWSGILLEKHITSPGERTGATIDWHVISVLKTACSRFEYRGEFGRWSSCFNRPGTITITPAGDVPDLRLHTETEMVHCALDPAFVERVAQEMDCEPPEPSFRPGIQDEGIRSIIGMLIKELEAEHSCGGLYVDSLARALATRYLLLGQMPSPPPAVERTPPNKRIPSAV